MIISMRDEKKIRIVDIENELGVRTAAASNVIHGKTKEISDTTVRKVQKMLAKTTFKGNAAYTPRLGYAKDEVFGYNDKSRKIIADLWSRVKVAASNA